MKKSIALFLIILPVGCGLTMNYTIKNKNKRIRYFLNSHINQSEIPGIQYLVMDSSNIDFKYCGGWADIKNQKPMTSTTTMMAYSMTKTITAVRCVFIRSKRLQQLLW